MCYVQTIIKTILVFIISYLIAAGPLMVYPPYRFIYGFLIAAIYFTIVILRSQSDKYERRVKNGLKWMVVSLLLGILPRIMLLLFYGITSYASTPSSIYISNLIEDYPFLLGPFAVLSNTLYTLFPDNELNTAIAVTIWLLVPFIVGFFIVRKQDSGKKMVK